MCDHYSEEDKDEKKESNVGCGEKQPKFTKINGQIWIEKAECQKLVDRKGPLKASDALRVLKFLTKEDCHILGFNPEFSHPKNMILEVLPVLPTPSRPTVEVDVTFKSEDDLTH